MPLIQLRIIALLCRLYGRAYLLCSSSLVLPGKLILMMRGCNRWQQTRVPSQQPQGCS